MTMKCLLAGCAASLVPAWGLAGAADQIIPRENHGVNEVRTANALPHFPSARKYRIAGLPQWHGGGFTLELWVKPEVAECGYAVLKKRSFGFPNFFKEGKFSVYVAPNAYPYWIDNPAGPGTWQHLVWSGTQDKLRIYFNGKLLWEKAVNGIPPLSAEPLLIGESMGWNKDFQGWIGLVRIYERSLDAKEIADHYCLLRAGKKLPESDAIWETGAADGRKQWDFTPGAWLKTGPVKVNQSGFEASVTLTPATGAASTPLELADVFSLSLSADGRLKARLKTTEGEFRTASSAPLPPGRRAAATVAWNGNFLQLFLNGKTVGYAVQTAGRPAVSESAFRLGGNYRGRLEALKFGFCRMLAAALGKKVVKPADNDCKDAPCLPRSRHLEGMTEREKPQLDFEDLSGWSVESVGGFAEGELARSREQPLWGDYTGRITLRQGNCRLQYGARVVMRPPRPIPIRDSFDAVNAWVFSKGFHIRPTLEILFQVRDKYGKLHEFSLNYEGISWLHWRGWGIWHRPLQQTIEAPAQFVGIVFQKLNEPERVIFMDSVRFYKRAKKPLADAHVPAWKELGIPTTPDTILPGEGKPSSAIRFAGNRRDGWRWSNGKVTFLCRPRSGTFSDLKVNWRGKTWTPMHGGGWLFAVGNEQYPVGSSEVKAKLQNSTVTGNKLKLDWQYLVGGKTMRSLWELEMKNNSLILSVSGDSGLVGECQVGHVAGVENAKVFEVPCLKMSGWRKQSFSPGVMYAGGMFYSCLFDPYNSDASELVGNSSGRPAGSFQWNRTTADLRWVPGKEEKGASNKVPVVNGGSVYFPKTDGKRNPPKERIFLTVSDRFDEVLPNIPHPPYKWNRESASRLWVTRMWYVNQLPYPNYFQEEFAFWKKMADYGAAELNVRFHGNLYRMYTPLFNGDPMTFIRRIIEPRIGGDEGCREFFRKMKKLGMRVGLYTDHTLLAPLAYEAWDEDFLTLNSNGNWEYGSDGSMQVKNSRMLILQKKYNRIFREKINPDCSYLDQLTCPPVWRYTDYDARAPEAGKFSAAYRVFIESLRQEERDFGPVLSEGMMQWMFAGICDSYAQVQRADMPLLPNFNLKKLHLLSNDCGYHLQVVSEQRKKERVYELLAYEMAYGNTGHLFWTYNGAPPRDITPCLTSYYLIQGLQGFYANVPVKRILYWVNGKLAEVEEAVKADALNENRVKLEYDNGLEVYVNLKPSSVWNVTLQGKPYALPFAGFAAALGDKALVYSALRDGKRVDYALTPDYLYVDGRGRMTDFGLVRTAGGCIVRRTPDGLAITPVEPGKGEKVFVRADKGKLVRLDENGKKIGEQSGFDPALGIAADGKTFSYLVKPE